MQNHMWYWWANTKSVQYCKIHFRNKWAYSLHFIFFVILQYAQEACVFHLKAFLTQCSLMQYHIRPIKTMKCCKFITSWLYSQHIIFFTTYESHNKVECYIKLCSKGFLERNTLSYRAYFWSFRSSKVLWIQPYIIKMHHYKVVYFLHPYSLM
jgi:hypothetical protein